MGRGKLPLRLIEKERARRITCVKRKQGLTKKAYELSTLCDIRVCLVIHDPEESCLKTFPENLGEVRQIVDDYFSAKAKNPDSNSKRDKTLADFYSERITKLRSDAERRVSRDGDPVWDSKIDDFTHEELLELLASLDRRIVEISAIKADRERNMKKAIVVAANNVGADLPHHQGSSSSNGGSSALPMFDHDHDYHQATPFDMIQWTAAMNNPPSYTRLLEAPNNFCAFDDGFESSSAAATHGNYNTQININNNISDGVSGGNYYYYQNVDHGAPLYPMYQNARLYGNGSSSAQYFPGEFNYGPVMLEDHKVYGNPTHLGFFGKSGSGGFN